jgi:hypothetical protein
MVAERVKQDLSYAQSVFPSVSREGAWHPWVGARGELGGRTGSFCGGFADDVVWHSFPARGDIDFCLKKSRRAIAQKMKGRERREFL